VNRVVNPTYQLHPVCWLQTKISCFRPMRLQYLNGF